MLLWVTVSPASHLACDTRKDAERAMDAGLFIPISVGIVLLLLAWFVPPQRFGENEPPPTEEEHASAREWEARSMGIWLALAMVLGLAWWGLLLLLAALVLRPDADTAFVLAPGPDALAIPAIFLGIASGLWALEWALRALLRGRYARIDCAWRERASFDTRKVVKGLTWLVAAGTVAFLVLWAGNITRLGTYGIDRGEPFSLRRERLPSSRIRAVQERSVFRAPNGNWVYRRHHAIVFDDGSEWTTQDVVRAPLDTDVAAMTYAAERAGLAIEILP
jgi:hypothetical protein